jgi:hypothetical protein
MSSKSCRDEDEISASTSLSLKFCVVGESVWETMVVKLGRAQLCKRSC